MNIGDTRERELLDLGCFLSAVSRATTLAYITRTDLTHRFLRVGQALDLNDAVPHMKAFRASWNLVTSLRRSLGEGTAEDIDAILSFVTDFPSGD
jgi:hypothetical protein